MGNTPLATKTFFYGWIMLPLATLIQVGTSPGQTFGVAAFNPSLRETLKLSHQALTGSYLLASLLAAVPLPFIGGLIDRFGLKTTSLWVIGFLGIGCMVMSQATGLITLTLGFFMLRAFGQGALMLIGNNTLAMWFSRRLGFVSGIAGVGVAVAVALIPPGYLSMIHGIGWQNAYVIVALITWALLIPIVFCYRNRPEDVGQLIDGDIIDHETEQIAPVVPISLDLKTAQRSRAYWIGMMLTSFWGMIATGITFNVIPIFEWQGLPASYATATFITFAICMAVMQLIGGILADRLPLNILFAVCMIGLLGGILTLWRATSVWMAHLYSVQFGIAQGLLVAVNNTYWARYFGRDHLGQIRSRVWTATVASCAIGPYLMGVSFDYFGSYGPSLALFVALVTFGFFTALFATPPTQNEVHHNYSVCDVNN